MIEPHGPRAPILLGTSDTAGHGIGALADCYASDFGRPGVNRQEIRIDAKP